MIVRFPYLYTGVAGRGEREQKVTMGAWGNVEIPEYEADDAPVFVSYTSTSENGRPYDVSIRQHEGHCYRPRTSRSANGYVPAVDGVDNLTVHDFIQRRPLFTSYALVDNLGLPDHVHRGLHSEFDPHDRIAARADAIPARVARHNQADVYAQHVRAAGELIIVDGEIWERCPMPELEVDFFWTPPKAEIVYSAKARPGPPSEKAILPLHVAGAALDDMVLAMSDPTLLQGDNAQPWTPDDVVAPQIHFSGGFTPGSAVVDYAVDRARTFLSYCASKYDYPLERFSTGFIRQWADFKDAIEHALDNPSEDANQAFVDTWGKMTASLERDIDHMGGLVKKHFRRVLIRANAELEASRNALFTPDHALDAAPSAPRM